MTEDQWDEYLKRSKTWAIRISYELLHSKAFRELTYAPAIKVLVWFHEKVKVEINKKRRGKDRYRVLDRDIEFTYREAGFRGLTPHKFRTALKQLHNFGFIDITKPGSALRGDFTLFALSDRWILYGSAGFKSMEIPKSVHWINFGFGARRKRSEKS